MMELNGDRVETARFQSLENGSRKVPIIGNERAARSTFYSTVSNPWNPTVPGHKIFSNPWKSNVEWASRPFILARPEGEVGHE